MANVQIGKYKRPGIFIEEFDRSIISSPEVDGITNMVIGVSKKGPVNTPIRIQSIGDLEALYGQLDRNLERKGSFFHRTISKMLETSPVFAMNLLLTDDELDKIEYRSISASSGFKNDEKREGPYRRFFDTTGFWKRDTDSFLNLISDNKNEDERAFALTNMSDRPISVFVVKSSSSDFDRTLLEWYGSEEKLPTYVNSSDYASDYLVDVVVVGGDWSNYQDLAVDPRWSQYFSPSGLIKERLRDFANDRNVNLLEYYDNLSLIPYFRDLNGNNMFIETIINRDTDRTGLFCAFDNDLIEEDFYNGKLDLIGHTIVGRNETNVDFLSYKELIAEEIRIENTPLDLPGNVTGLFGGTTHSYNSQDIPNYGENTWTAGDEIPTEGVLRNGNRNAYFAEGSVYNVTFDSISSASMSMSVDYNVDNNAFAVIGGNKVDLEAGVVTLSADSSSFPIEPGGTASYTAAFVLNSAGDINLVSTTSPNTNPSVSTTDIVLGKVDFDITSNGEFDNVTATNITVDNSGFIDLVFQTDYEINDLGSGRIEVVFLGTNTQQSVTNYEQYRKFKAFNTLVNVLDNPRRERMAINLGPNNDYKKVLLDETEIENIVTSTFDNKSFELATNLTTADLSDVLDGYLVLYTVDNELILGSNEMITKEGLATATVGVVGRWSDMYSRFFDGIINTRDFFWKNRLWVDSNNTANSLLGETVDVTFITGDEAQGVTSSYAGNNYVIFESDQQFDTQFEYGIGEQLVFPSAILNVGTITRVSDSVDPNNSANQLANQLGYAGSDFYAYQVSEIVEFETLNDIDVVYNANDKAYLKMFIDNEGAMTVRFKDETLEFISEVNILANDKFFVQSRRGNFKQTLEINFPEDYERVPNKILVSAERYSEVRKGDFLEAYVNPDNLEDGEAARKLTRILSKRRFSGNPDLVEITCDSRIKVYEFNGSLQTTRYQTIDSYSSSYKAISLKGFKLRKESLPDGTEERQSQILNLVAKGTPIFRALTNKEAIDFRYLIDSFGLGLTENSKQQLVDICGDRLDCLGFINMPSMKSFKNSASPTFVNSEGVLQAELIAQGGDEEQNPAFLYSFAEGSGNTSVGYFAPYLRVNDNGRPLDVPPSSFVATTYMRKHISNVTNITPWTIAAGVNNGRITGITGLEIDFTPQDIEFLNQAQMNPVVFKRNRGYVIETQNTGQTSIKSALSLINVREVLIELERDLAAMLLDYQWRFNTPDVRAEIKLRADTICENYVSKNGLFNYFNKMDDENNTPELIDNQVGVLDTFVEPLKGLGIIVNNITILRTGAIDAGGFINQ